MLKTGQMHFDLISSVASNKHNFVRIRGEICCLHVRIYEFPVELIVS